MANTFVMILAGGEGKRLSPLTKERAKPSVPFGGTYRIIDFVLSNFVNSGFLQIKVLTQFMSESLNRHITRNWQLSHSLNQYVESVPAQMRTGGNWYLGSADAIYQNLNLIRDESPDHTFVFSGDHIYKMDISQMHRFHIRRKADMTVAAIPVPISEASQFGVIEVDENYQMVGFEEKPAKPKPMPGDSNYALVSMGNYLFNTKTLVDAVTKDAEDKESVHDFGKNIIPALYGNKKVYVYDYLQNKIAISGLDIEEKPYWRDVGTIYAYWQAHMDLVAVNPAFNLYNRAWPIFGCPEKELPPAKFVFSDEYNNRMGVAIDSIVAQGSIISGGRVFRSVLSPCVRVNSYSHIENSIILSDVSIGRYSKIKNAIIDKNVVVPYDTEIGYDLELDRQRGFTVTPEGIVVVPKGYVFEN